MTSGTPKEQGFRMPAEWEPHEAIWLSWPAHPESWPNKREAIEQQFADIAAAISRHEAVRINAAAESHARIEQTLRDANAEMASIQLFAHPNDDVWCRDHGPIFVKKGEDGSLAVTDWGFNGWGDKFQPYDLDDAIPSQIATALELPLYDGGMILEGGSIEVNSRGQLLTTEAVLLNPNRNPHLSREEIETRLKDTLGIVEIIWLGQGIEGDDTDGHIDDIARFIDDTTIVLSWERDDRSPNHRVLYENRERLQDMRTPEGSKLEIIEIPLPQACEVPGWRLPVLPASYVNFLILNDAVLVPTFDQKRGDTQGCGILGELFGGREIVPIPCIDIVEEGGTIHCLSQQQPTSGS